MDRNLWWGVRKAVGSLVALRKESVDRNTQRRDFKRLGLLSLSARRAWIEISRAETAKTSNAESLSARRAWIEIRMTRRQWRVASVALRKESVDRNDLSLLMYPRKYGSLSARRAWIEIIDSLGSRIYDMSSLSARRAWIEITQCKL